MSTVQEFEIKDAAARAADAAADLDEDGDIQGEKMVLNMGPSHPATHGVLRVTLELDGEVITKAIPDVGYLHRGDEKTRREHDLHAVHPVHGPAGLPGAAGEQRGLRAGGGETGWDRWGDLPPRCQHIRVICCELARISAHLLGLGRVCDGRGRGDGISAHVHRAREDLQPDRGIDRGPIHDDLHPDWRTCAGSA